MPPTVEVSEEIVAGWRSGEVEGPAGPVLPGTYAESEITMPSALRTRTCGTVCSISPTRMCC
ncbi:DUF6229 family protein [Rhizohabitans arisaemae]|uniref:DUF6229 family protein n=1 Tax=Rhizohabitans arisaemae TaxID=2720610 RepID=UPI0024B0611C|nr:DUF6229 family protein [Rhizohabitans arisaemae]